MKNDFRVGVLSKINAPLLGHIIQAILDAGVQLAAVILDSKQGSQRDLDIWIDRVGDNITPIPFQCFEGSHIPFYFMTDANSAESVKLYKKLDVDLLVNGGVPRILKQAVLNSAHTGVVNVHPGLIPEYRGCCCIEWAIYNNDPVGNTIHLMSEEIDMGIILRRRVVDVRNENAFNQVCSKVYLDGIDLLAETLRGLQDGSLKIGSPLGPDQKGVYFKPIDQNTLTRVKEMVKGGEYVPQYPSAFQT